MMKKTIYAAVVLMFVLTGCAGTKLVSQWSQPGYNGPAFKNLLIIGIFKDDLRRHMYEDAFVEQLRGYGVKAVASYTVVPKLSGKKEQDKKRIKAAVAKLNSDAVIVATLVGIDKDQRYVPSAPVYVSRYGGPYGMYGYYGHSYSVIQQPGYFVDNTTVKLRATLFAVKDEKMLWTGDTNSFNPDTAQQIADANVKLVSAALKRDGML